MRYVFEEDGVIYKTTYDRDGIIVGKWKWVPIPGTEDTYAIYVWDEETEEWLIDQDENGTPDEVENPRDPSDFGNPSPPDYSAFPAAPKPSVFA